MYYNKLDGLERGKMEAGTPDKRVWKKIIKEYKGKLRQNILKVKLKQC